MKDEIYLGLTWRDMPHTSNEMKKMNFALFKKCKLSPRHLENKMEAEALRFYKESFFSSVKRSRFREEKLNAERK